MYVLRAKVRIAIEDGILLGVSGRSVAEDLPLLGVKKMEDATVIRLGSNRFQFFTKEPQALWKKLAESAQPAGSVHWDWLNIRSGIPVILEKTQDQFVPQMVNFDLIGGINFKKGCYPGQEIVARMHYLGKLKRRMYLAHVEADAKPGDELYSEDMAGQACGMIANAVPSPSGGCDLLAVIQTASRDAHKIHHGSLEGPELSFEALPYSLTQEVKA
jgi:folate-binding protein YgfZ